MDIVEIIGFAAAALGTVSLLPQVIKIWKSRSTESISLLMYVSISINSTLWITYAFMRGANPLLFQSFFTFVCALSIVIMKLMWSNKDNK